MKFYDCSTAPSPRRVRMYMAEKGIEIPVIQIDLRSGEHLREEFRKVNPDCTVPVLELDDGTCLTEVYAICQYLEATFPEPSLIGSTSTEAAQVTMWNTKIEQQGLGAIAESIRNYSKGFKGRALTGPVGFEQIPELAERGRHRAAVFMNTLDQQLGENEFIIGDVFTIADITAMVFTDFSSWIKLPIPETASNLLRWKTLVADRPAAQV